MALKLKYKFGNKRGMFFTMMAIVILFVFFLTYSVYNIADDRKSIDRRIDSMNNIVFSLQKDMSRQGYISSFRAIIALESYITTNGTFLTDPQASINETLLNGTINGQPVSLMENYKLGDWNSAVQEFGNSMNLIINYSLRNVTVTQTDPWNVDINMAIDLYIADKGGLASWNGTRIITSKVEITSFEDPFYAVYTGGKDPHKMKKTIYQPFSNLDLNPLRAHNNNSYYIASSSGPSFLKRLQGNFSNDTNGIESLVYVPDLPLSVIKDKSIVDYIYFNPANDPDWYTITGIPSPWFKLDNENNHLAIYNVSDLAIHCSSC